MDAGDGKEAEEAVFYRGAELGVDGFVGAGGGEDDLCAKAGGDAGDASAGGVGVGLEGGGTYEAGGDDVTAEGGDEAIPEGVEEVGLGEGGQM